MNIATNLDQLLIHLPSSLKELKLPQDYRIQTNEKIILPPSLDMFRYHTRCSELMKFVVPPNKEYNNIRARIEESSDVEWLHNQCWVIRILVNIDSAEHSVPHMPSHIKHLNIYMSPTIGENVLPKGLEYHTKGYWFSYQLN